MSELTVKINNLNRKIFEYKESLWTSFWHEAAIEIRRRLSSDLEPFSRWEVMFRIQTKINEKHSSFSN